MFETKRCGRCAPRRRRAASAIEHPGACAVALVLLAQASPAGAALIEYRYTGSVVITQGQYAEIAPFAPASGSLRYNTDWPRLGTAPSGDGLRSGYGPDDGQWNLTLESGAVSFAANTPLLERSPGLVVQDNGTVPEGLIFDQMTFFGRTAGIDWLLALDETLVAPAVPDAFSSTAIPETLVVGDFNRAFIQLRPENSLLRVRIETLERVAQVPAPSPMVLLGAVALAAIGARGGSRVALRRVPWGGDGC